jgi:hypothetical protein
MGTRGDVSRTEETPMLAFDMNVRPAIPSRLPGDVVALQRNTYRR